MLISGDTIIDWIIHKGKVTPTVGGAGNIVRGLKSLKHDVQFLTLYNPMLYPLSYTMNLHPLSLTDFNHRNVFIRDYDRDIFQRFRENLKSNVIDIKGATAVICHEDSIIRRFQSFYADIRDTSVRGECSILRMSSSDDVDSIMAKIDHKIAIVTYKDKVQIRGLYIGYPQKWDTIWLDKVEAKDDIGAGDTFDIGFLNSMALHGNKVEDNLKSAILDGIGLAQNKVQNIGVFIK